MRAFDNGVEEADIAARGTNRTARKKAPRCPTRLMHKKEARSHRSGKMHRKWRQDAQDPTEAARCTEKWREDAQ